MEIKIKIKFQDDLIIDLNNFLNEEVILEKYTEKQLKEIRKELFHQMENENLSSEQLEECHYAFEITKNALYINNKIPLRCLDKIYLRHLSNENLTNTRNSMVRILNQHILLYNDAHLPLYSKTIEIVSKVLVNLKNEMEYRNLNTNISKKEKQNIQESIAKWYNNNKPVSRFEY